MIESLLKGFALGSILAISVGPVIFTVLKQSIVNGKEGGFSFVAGVWLSDILLIFICNAFSEIVQNFMIYQKTIGYVGSGFLIAMGLYYLLFKKGQIKQGFEGNVTSLNKHDYIKILGSGFLLNTLNPGVLFFWLTSATAFALTHTHNERLIIFGSCMALNISVDILKVFLAGKIRKKLTASAIGVVNKIAGTILIVFGAVLLWGTYFALTKHHWS